MSDEETEEQPMPLPESGTFVPVPGYPGVVTCPSLRAYNLGFAGPENIICCITCPRIMLLNLTTCSDHVKTHLPAPSNPRKTIRVPRTRIMEICRRFNAYSGLLNEIPLPPSPAIPYQFLPIQEAWCCLLCEDVSNNIFNLSISSRNTHFLSFHGNSAVTREASEALVPVQTFCEQYPGKRFFRVHPELSAAQVLDADEQYAILPAPVAELVQAFHDEWTPAPKPIVSVESLKEVQPFVYYTGWARLVDNKDISFLQSLVKDPEPDDPLRYLLNAALDLFREDQLGLPDISEIYRVLLLDDETGISATRMLVPIEAESRKEYGGTWGLWAVFLCRLYPLIKAGDDRISCLMTQDQQQAVEYALEYCTESKTRRSPEFTILNLSRQFWRPDSMEDFDPLADNQFNDPTVLFGALINLRQDGSFAAPRNSCHKLVIIKYVMRVGLFMWSRREQAKKKKPKKFIVEYIRCALSRRLISPFACICIAVGHASTYASTTTSLPNVIWSGNHTLRLDGMDLTWPLLRTTIAQEIIDLEQFVLQDVLLGISLDELGFAINEKTKLRDKLDDTTAGYSMFSDPENPFRRMTHNLANQFFRLPAATNLHQGVFFDENKVKRVAWDDKQIGDWLLVCERASKRLLFIMHIVGGQPGRGVEMCLVNVENALYRVRNFYYIAPGRIIYVLFYNKTTAGTRHDRPIAHAVPWMVGRLFMIMHALVSPLVGVLTQRVVESPTARALHVQAGFASFGKRLSPVDLGYEIESWFFRHHNIKIRIRLLRHLIIACQRHLMPEAFGPMRRALHIVDAQVGHSTETAEAHYALDTSKTTFLLTDTVLKYVLASAHWWQVLWVCLGVLHNAKTRYASNASDILQRGDDYARMGRTRLEIKDEEVKTLGTQLAVDGQIADSVVDRFFLKSNQFAANFAGHLTLQMHALSPPPPPLHLPEGAQGSLPIAPTSAQVDFATRLFSSAPARMLVEPKHLELLRRFVKDPNATWSSPAQAQALVHVLARRTSLLCVLPTGGGKSVLFAAMPYIETGVTVVVFPLRALMLDQCLTSKRRDPHCPFAIWSPKLSVNNRVVAVMIDLVVNPAFVNWCTIMHARGTLNRIVLDECHLIITASDYRPVMHSLKLLVQAGVPLLCTSGTIPPVMEFALSHCIGSPSLTVHRVGTQRTNLHIRLAELHSSAKALESLVMHVRIFQQSLAPGEGILILCRSYFDVDKVADALHCPAYTAHTLEIEKDRIAESWLDGQINTVASTSALGTGVHHPACRFVIHYGVPYGMIDFAQEIGRAGRDGLDALSLMFYWRPYPVAKPVDLKGYGPLLEMLDGQKCCRFYMSCYLDGEGLMESCSSTGYRECGRCVVMMSRAALRPGIGLAGPDSLSPGREIMSSVELTPNLPAFAIQPLGILPAPDIAPPVHAIPVALPAHIPEPLPPTRREITQRDLDLAVDSAGLPATIGLAVLEDAENGRLRNMGSSEAEAAEERRCHPYSFPCLLARDTQHLATASTPAQNFPPKSVTTGWQVIQSTA
ncbi:P-loop containing nucleoside triphosphate hydrolase protein [Ceratobasidium sp. AG-I]|nr:P-loop containing nucleoside triphosphate hydrolase protein [Ceratobasidium sp. AG-I]